MELAPESGWLDDTVLSGDDTRVVAFEAGGFAGCCSRGDGGSIGGTTTEGAKLTVLLLLRVTRGARAGVTVAAAP